MIEENENIYGKRLKEVLEELEVKQSELAKSCYITEATISNYISGKQLPKLGVVERIANRLNISVDYLLGLSDIKSYYYNEDYLDEEKLLIKGDILFVDFLFRDKPDSNINDKIKIIDDLLIELQIYLRELKRQKNNLSSSEEREDAFFTSIHRIETEIIFNTKKLRGLTKIKEQLEEIKDK